VIKLDGLPKIYYINLDTAIDRNQYMLGMFKKNSITNFERFEAKRHVWSKHEKLNPSEYGCMVSHLSVLEIIANSEDDYAIIAEDDLDITTINQWSFTWQEFFDKLPNFDIVQLVRHQYLDQFYDRGNKVRTGAKFKVWDKGDVSTVAYLVTKEYAKKATELYEKDKDGLSYFLNYSDTVGPVSDVGLYGGFNSYSTCLFGFQMFESQTDESKIPKKAFIDNVKYMKKIFQKGISLDDIF